MAARSFQQSPCWQDMSVPHQQQTYWAQAPQAMFQGQMRQDVLGGNGHSTLRIVLLGKTGAGKSSLGNALTGRKPPKVDPKAKRDEKPPERSKDPNVGFKVGKGLRSETVYCDWSKAERFGTVLEVTDTPGLCDTHLPEKDIYREVAKSVAVAEPGPNVIIFTLRCDRRFTEEEYLAYSKIKELFSEEMNKYLILVFNGLDVYDDLETISEQREVLSEEIKKFGDRLNDMVQQAEDRVMGMNNKAPQPDKDKQIEDLINMMKALVQKNGKDGYYKTEMTEEIMRKVEEMAAGEAESKGMSQDEARDDLKTNIISETVEPSFFGSLYDSVKRAAVKVKNGVKSMCSVM